VCVCVIIPFRFIKVVLNFLSVISVNLSVV
jgi:hypothetical protein